MDFLNPEEVEVVIQLADEAEADEMWSYVQRKTNSRWLWHVIDHRSGKILAYIFGRRQDEALLKLKTLLAPFGITKWKSTSETLPDSEDRKQVHPASDTNQTLGASHTLLFQDGTDA